MAKIWIRQAVLRALDDALADDPTVIVMGEDIAAAGGPFKVTEGLLAAHGPDRVIDTPISEAGFTGIAVGAAMAGMRPVVDIMFGDCLTLVMDQLNTHSPASFYEAFEPAEAKRLTDKLEIHYTPKHGSWLNIAEIELSALSRQCLDRRIPDAEILKREVAAWKAGRNDAKTRVRWRFTTANARIKLHRLYPSIKP